MVCLCLVIVKLILCLTEDIISIVAILIVTKKQINLNLILSIFIMGKLDWTGILTGGIVPGISAALNLGSSALANHQQGKMQDKQNAFNAEQSELNRSFQSREAEIARDWQEEQYNKYSSPQAMMRQYKEAGLNPALMYGQNLQSSTGSSSSPSGSAASGSTPSAFMSDMAGIIQSFLGLAKLKQDIKESESRVNANNAAAFASERAGLASNAGAVQSYSQAKLNSTIQKLTKKQISELDQKIRLMSEQEISERRKQRLMLVQTAIHNAEKKQIDLKNALSSAFKEKFGYDADAATITTLMNIAGNVVSSTVSSALDIFSMFKGFGKGKNKKSSLSEFIPFSEITGNVE